MVADVFGAVQGDSDNNVQETVLLAEHPLLAEVGHHATSWLLVADAFAGHADDVLTGSVRLLDACATAHLGRPCRGETVSGR
ncbi:hypothetical protein [Streptomyces sp. HC307]|uniref:hypothetical protein n=1 Tax=Streptomyces flavusporus TaxID=3385496 RepID=UPI0039174659